MIIHPPEEIAEKGEIKISARIETSKLIANFPEVLWFSFPEAYRPYITPRSEAFLLAMLAPAMYFNEPIEVRGAISPKLAFNLQEFVYLYHQFFGLHLIEFTATELKAYQPNQNPEAVVLSFSGGVDSMFSLYMNLPENQPIKEAQVTHGLLIHGFNEFDIALKDFAYFQRVYTRYRKLFDGFGLELLTGKTNAYDFSKFRIDWGIGHVPTMVAFAYLLSNLVNVLYKASDGDHVQLRNYDPVLMSNYLLSCETIDVVSHTGVYNRVEKMEILAYWPPAYDNLRVCLAWDKQEVALNCSRCYKCLATMILFNIIGVYEKFTSFEQPYSKLALFKFFLQPKLGVILTRHIVPTAKKYKHFGFLFWFYLLYYPNKLRVWILKKIDHALSDKHKYMIRDRLYNKRVFDVPQDSSRKD